MENQIQILEAVCNDDLTIDILFNDSTRQRIDIGGAKCRRRNARRAFFARSVDRLLR